MAAKKAQEKAATKHGIWLNQSGTLSFGTGMDGEASIDRDTYDRLKSLDASKRWDARVIKEEPKAEAEATPEAAPAQETQANAAQA